MSLRLRLRAAARARRAPALVLALGGLVVAAPAAASPWSVPLRGAAASPTQADLAEAQREYQLGTQAYALGNYDQAVAHFERSYALSDRPELLFNIGQSYAQWYTLSADLAHLRKARKLFENYLKYLDAAQEDDPEARDDAVRRIAEIDAEIAAVEARGAGPGPVEVAPEPAPAPAPAPAPERRPIHRRGWFWGVVIGGAVLIAGGITAGVLAARPDPFEPELGIIGRGLAAPGPAPLVRF